MNKRGVELSVNFIVMLVLGLALFGTGIYIATQIFSGTEQIASSVDNNIQNAIEAELRDTSKPVSLGINRKELERGDNSVFGVGVANREPATHTYEIVTTFLFLDDGSGAKLDPTSQDRPRFPTVAANTDLNKVTVEPNNVQVVSLPVIVPNTAQSGTYVFGLDVAKTNCATDCAITTQQRLYVDVK